MRKHTRGAPNGRKIACLLYAKKEPMRKRRIAPVLRLTLLRGVHFRLIRVRMNESIARNRRASLVFSGLMQSSMSLS